MPTQTLGIIVNGATGRICSTQHLKNSLIAIRDQGGLAVGDKQVIPRPMLVGRDAARLAEVARTYGVADWTDDVDAALADAAFPVFFDAAATGGRLALLKKAVAAGKHIYSEKPVVPSVADGRALLAAAQARGLKHGAVEDKLYLPGFRKLARVLGEGTLGRIVGFKLEFGWWVFDGVEAPTQRPSWNYRRATGGGLVLDMFPHWRYVIEGLLGRIRRVAAATSTAIPERVDEHGERYRVDVEDGASALVELESGAFGTVLGSTALYPGAPPRITIGGADGMAMAEEGLKTFKFRDPRDDDAKLLNGLAVVPTPSSSSKDPAIVEAAVRLHAANISSILDAWSAGRDADTSGAEMRKSVAIVLAMYESMRNGGAAIEVK